MNLATILVAIPVAALIIWALIRTIKNRGKCGSCLRGGSGACSACGACGACNGSENGQESR